MKYGNSIVGTNPYRAEVIKQNLEWMAKDKYYIARLVGDNGVKAINIDEAELKLLLAFYEGKEITIHETDDKK